MKTLQKLALAALVVGVGAQFATLPVLADKPGRGAWASVALESVGDEPQAAGHAIVNNVNADDYGGYPMYSIRASVTCEGLTPGASYQTELGTFTANRNGKGAINGTVILIDSLTGPYEGSFVSEWLWTVTVVRLNPDGSTTLVLACAW